jgi:hypothetical protein
MKKPLITLAVLSISNYAALAQSYDANKDGNVSREEYKQVWEGQFDYLDKSQSLDGKLTQAEWASPSFPHVDKNVDGSVDKDEWLAARMSEFDAIDANDDGVADASEWSPKK